MILSEQIIKTCRSRSSMDVGTSEADCTRLDASLIGLKTLAVEHVFEQCSSPLTWARTEKNSGP